MNSIGTTSIEVGEELGDVYNTFQTISVEVDSLEWTNELRIVDTGDPSNVGFALDYVLVQDYGCIEPA